MFMWESLADEGDGPAERWCFDKAFRVETEGSGGTLRSKSPDPGKAVLRSKTQGWAALPRGTFR